MKYNEYLLTEDKNMKAKFSVTYAIASEESAEHGEYEEQGFIDKNLDLHDAIEELFRTRVCAVGGIESIGPDCSDHSQARWIHVSNGMEFETGFYESRTLHFPESLTPSSRRRLVKLLA